MVFIEKGLSSAIKLDSCPFQIISIDAFNQITLGSMEMGIPILENQIDLKKDFIFRLENSFPCLSTIIPDNSSILEGKSNIRFSIIIKTSMLTKDQNSLEKKELTVSLKLRNCEYGEYFDMEGKKCVDCDPNFFSFKSNFFEPSACKSCENEPFFAMEEIFYPRRAVIGAVAQYQ